MIVQCVFRQMDGMEVPIGDIVRWLMGKCGRINDNRT